MDGDGLQTYQPRGSKKPASTGNDLLAWALLLLSDYYAEAGVDDGVARYLTSYFRV